MDSVPSPLPLAVRDGSPEAAAMAELAKEAALLFQAGNFLDCLRVLNQLLQKKADDPKVIIEKNQLLLLIIQVDLFVCTTARTYGKHAVA